MLSWPCSTSCLLWVQATQGNDLDPANEGLGFNLQLKLHDGFIDVSYYCILASRSRSWVMNPWRNGIFQVVTNANCQGSTLSNFFLVESQLGRR